MEAPSADGGGDQGEASGAAAGMAAAVGGDGAAGLLASATRLRFERPSSKSPPIILSMFITSENALPTKLFLPSSDQVTRVLAGPVDLKSKAVSATDWKGSMNSSRSARRSGGCWSVMVIFPLPTFLFPSQAYDAPTPDVVAVNVLCMSASRLSQGDHWPQVFRSPTVANTVAAVAPTSSDRSTWSASGRVAITTSKATTATARTNKTLLNIGRLSNSTSMSTC